MTWSGVPGLLPVFGFVPCRKRITNFSRMSAPFCRRVPILGCMFRRYPTVMNRAEKRDFTFRCTTFEEVLCGIAGCIGHANICARPLTMQSCIRRCWKSATACRETWRLVGSNISSHCSATACWNHSRFEAITPYNAFIHSLLSCSVLS